MRFLNYIIFAIYFIGSTIFSINAAKVDLFDFLALMLNGITVICFFKLHQRFLKTGTSLPMVLLMTWAVLRIAYVGWGLQYDKYNLIQDEQYLYAVTFIILNWCMFELYGKKYHKEPLK
jgi:hypothetical protein